jgi:hypothetical protein
MKLLTTQRIRAYCFIILGINLLMLSLTFARGSKGLTVFGAPFGGDFAAFYAAGRIINEYGSDRLYDMKLQDTLIHAALSEVPADLSNTYVNSLHPGSDFDLGLPHLADFFCGSLRGRCVAGIAAQGQARFCPPLDK